MAAKRSRYLNMSKETYQIYLRASFDYNFISYDRKVFDAEEFGKAFGPRRITPEMVHYINPIELQDEKRAELQQLIQEDGSKDEMLRVLDELVRIGDWIHRYIKWSNTAHSINCGYGHR